MKKTACIFLFLLIAISQNAISQKIIRQSISCLGSSNANNGFLLRQTVGQSSNTTTFYHDSSSARQGFQQPLTDTYIKFFSDNNINVSVIPNPVQLNFIIKISGEDNTFFVNITDINGKLIFHSFIDSNIEHLIDCSKWSSGVYHLTIYKSNVLKVTKKIVKP